MERIKVEVFAEIRSTVDPVFLLGASLFVQKVYHCIVDVKSQTFLKMLENLRHLPSLGLILS